MKNPGLQITATGDLSVTINEGAWMDITGHVGSQEVYSHRFWVCDEVRKAKKAQKTGRFNLGANGAKDCPIQPGTHTLPSFMVIPDGIPPFTDIQVHAVAMNADGIQQLFCMDGTIMFQP